MVTSDWAELNAHLRRLNAFYPQGNGWTVHKAKKGRTDLFGDVIEVGDPYLSRQTPGGGWHSSRTLSIKSLQRLCEVLFHGNSDLEEQSDKLARDRWNAMTRQAADALNMIRQEHLGETVDR